MFATEAELDSAVLAVEARLGKKTVRRMILDGAYRHATGAIVVLFEHGTAVYVYPQDLPEVSDEALEKEACRALGVTQVWQVFAQDGAEDVPAGAVALFYSLNEPEDWVSSLVAVDGELWRWMQENDVTPDDLCARALRRDREERRVCAIIPAEVATLG